MELSNRMLNKKQVGKAAVVECSICCEQVDSFVCCQCCFVCCERNAIERSILMACVQCNTQLAPSVVQRNISDPESAAAYRHVCETIDFGIFKSCLPSYVSVAAISRKKDSVDGEIKKLHVELDSVAKRLTDAGRSVNRSRIHMNHLTEFGILFQNYLSSYFTDDFFDSKKEQKFHDDMVKTGIVQAKLIFYNKYREFLNSRCATILNQLGERTTFAQKKKDTVSYEVKVPYPCKTPNCKGYLDDKFFCALCTRKFCKKCHERIIEEEEEGVEEAVSKESNNYTASSLSKEAQAATAHADSASTVGGHPDPSNSLPDKKKKPKHTCDPVILETISKYYSKSKQCPNCRAPVEKIAECDHMFCPMCTTAFDYKTGRIMAANSNPYFQKARAEGLLKQNRGEEEKTEIPAPNENAGCTGIANQIPSYFFQRMMETSPNAWKQEVLHFKDFCSSAMSLYSHIGMLDFTQKFRQITVYDLSHQNMYISYLNNKKTDVDVKIQLARLRKDNDLRSESRDLFGFMHTVLRDSLNFIYNKLHPFFEASSRCDWSNMQSHVAIFKQSVINLIENVNRELKDFCVRYELLTYVVEDNSGILPDGTRATTDGIFFRVYYMTFEQKKEILSNAPKRIVKPKPKWREILEQKQKEQRRQKEEEERKEQADLFAAEEAQRQEEEAQRQEEDAAAAHDDLPSVVANSNKSGDSSKHTKEGEKAGTDLPSHKDGSVSDASTTEGEIRYPKKSRDRSLSVSPLDRVLTYNVKSDIGTDSEENSLDEDMGSADCLDASHFEGSADDTHLSQLSGSVSPSYSPTSPFIYKHSPTKHVVASNGKGKMKRKRIKKLSRHTKNTHKTRSESEDEEEPGTDLCERYAAKKQKAEKAIPLPDHPATSEFQTTKATITTTTIVENNESSQQNEKDTSTVKKKRLSEPILVRGKDGDEFYVIISDSEPE